MNRNISPAKAAPSWQRYLILPRAATLDKLVAELYRILRVARAVAFHPHGHIEAEDGIVKFNGAINRGALSAGDNAGGPRTP